MLNAPGTIDADYRGEVQVLLVNLGTPDDPSPAAVKRYLAEFLSDPRVVELPPLLWQPALAMARVTVAVVAATNLARYMPLYDWFGVIRAGVAGWVPSGGVGKATGLAGSLMEASVSRISVSRSGVIWGSSLPLSPFVMMT